MARSNYGTKRPTHHVTLSDGVTTIGLMLSTGQGVPDNRGISRYPIPSTTIRQGTGVPTYDDREPPYLAFAQSDWSGGIGNKEFSKDATRYFSGKNVDTIRGPILLGPGRETQYYNSEVSVSTGDAGANTQTLTYAGTYTLWASPVTVGATAIYLKSVRVKMNISAANTPIIVYLYSDSPGEPGSELAVGSVTVPNTGIQEIAIPITYFSMTAATKYWVVFDGGSGGAEKIYVNDAAGTIVERTGTGPDVWTERDSDSVIALEVSDTSPGEAIFFEYKDTAYMVTRQDEDEAPRLYRNGSLGACQSNAGNLDKTVLEAALDFSGFNMVGKVIKIIRGTGSAEEVPWRTIRSTGPAATDVFVSPNWTITQDATTEFVIQGDSWILIDSGDHGLTAPVTDVLVVDDIVYFAQGETTIMRRMRCLAVAGVWTEEFAAETGNYATHLELVTNTNGRYIYKTKASTANVKKAVVAAWGTNLDFSTPALSLVCGTADKRITNILPYGEFGYLFVVKENEIGFINTDDVYIPLPISEMKNVSSWRNGKAILAHGVYVYFSLLNGHLERYYDGRLDDVGPNRDEGLPDGYEGVVSHMVGFPGRIYVVVNAGMWGYSSVLCYNNSGWHPIYVADKVGKRLNRIHIQSIIGDPETFRMLVAEETNVFHLDVAISPEKDSNYTYADSGEVVSSWFYGGMKEVRKFWANIKQFSENLVEGTGSAIYTTMEYQLDNDSAWTSIATLDTSPIDSSDITADDSAAGRRFRYRLTLYSDGDTSPRIEAEVLTLVERLASNYGWKIRFTIKDGQLDLQGLRGQKLTAAEVYTQLATWADSDEQPTPLTMRSTIEAFDNVKVFIEPASVSPFTKAEEDQFYGEMTVMKK